MTAVCSNVNITNIDHLSLIRDRMFLIGQSRTKISSFC